MWRKKKLIITVVLAAVLLAGSIGGVALAQTDNTDNSDASQPKTLMERVAEILGVDQQKLEDAFDQAQSEMREEALDTYLQKMVDEGKITEEEAEQYKTWWQGKPDMEPYRQQLRDWQESKPDVSIPGPCGRLGGRGFMGGMEWGRGL